jgi:hypothetical protein
MLSHLKEFVKEHESDVILTIGIVLVALISFGVGRLTALPENKEPIVIQQSTAAIQQSLSGDFKKIDQRAESGKFVGSVESNKYHWPDCPWAKKITPENQVWFSSEAEAQSAGYIRCGNFEKYSPADYNP